MALHRVQIRPYNNCRTRNTKKAVKMLKKSMNRYIRRMNKEITDDDIAFKTARKPYYGWFD